MLLLSSLSVLMLLWVTLISVFFFKQKTAYEMRISDWSSDACSSDLRSLARQTAAAGEAQAQLLTARIGVKDFILTGSEESVRLVNERKIGRASCRERVCQSV